MSLRSYLVASLALYECGGATEAVDTEDVAIAANRIAPGMFAWRKYPDQVNLELVRVALSDAAKEKNGSLVAGRGRTGWSLTQAGLQWCEQNSRLVKAASLDGLERRRTAGSIDQKRLDREKARVESTAAWEQWLQDREGAELTLVAVRELFRIDHYADTRTRQLKMNRLHEMFGDDEDLGPFIEAAARLARDEGEE